MPPSGAPHGGRVVEHEGELGLDHAHREREHGDVRALERRAHALAIARLDELLRGARSRRLLEHGRAIDTRDDELGEAPPEAQRERAADQPEPEDRHACDGHCRTTAPIARSRSVSSTASLQRSVAGTRGTSFSGPTHTRKMMPSAPAPIAAPATAAQ
jgi:hypothetical protein